MSEEYSPTATDPLAELISQADSTRLFEDLCEEEKFRKKRELPRIQAEKLQALLFMFTSSAPQKFDLELWKAVHRQILFNALIDLRSTVMVTAPLRKSQQPAKGWVSCDSPCEAACVLHPISMRLEGKHKRLMKEASSSVVLTIKFRGSRAPTVDKVGARRDDHRLTLDVHMLIDQTKPSTSQLLRFLQTLMVAGTEHAICTPNGKIGIAIRVTSTGACHDPPAKKFSVPVEGFRRHNIHYKAQTQEGPSFNSKLQTNSCLDPLPTFVAMMNSRGFNARDSDVRLSLNVLVAPLYANPLAVVHTRPILISPRLTEGALDPFVERSISDAASNKRPFMENFILRTNAR
eukprot:Gregarina_sp_Poly_1__1604@NODE_1406_length_4213_cov_32_136035_g936_i0_p3_GENE_NODE_1406_length_4213_cov_32_136035_g936_i0NODE_1406_length_4213_cov_32_136035_g936_i0_p3_ORF_typecomplete_len372_score47_80_NODE_1406_length_4213_cov_32_136035_g936_i0771117